MRLNDKILLLNNFEKGADEQSCQNLMKKIEGLNLEIDTEIVNSNTLVERAGQLSPEYEDRCRELVVMIMMIVIMIFVFHYTEELRNAIRFEFLFVITICLYCYIALPHSAYGLRASHVNTGFVLSI